MAGIDKTYGTRDQSVAMHAWLKRHRPRMLRLHYGFEHWDDEPGFTGDDERPILNTGTDDDRWLVRYCPFRFFLERMVFVYNERNKIRQIAELRLAAGDGETVPTYRMARKA